MRKEFGKVPKDNIFIVTKRHNCLYAGWETSCIISGVTLQDLKKFVKYAEKKDKINKKKTHFIHLSPDVTFLMRRKDAK